MLFVNESVHATLQTIVDLAVGTIEGCDGAAILLVTKREILAGSWTNERVRRVEEAEYSLGEGPCVNAIWEQPTFESADLRNHLTEWPRFVPIALEMGIASMLAFRLFAAGDTLGALDLYSYQPGVFDETTRAIGTVFAAHAALALAGAQVHERDLEVAKQLQEALLSRDLIGQAKGILMASRDIRADEAFDALRETSQHENMKVREVAQRVVEFGDVIKP